MRGNHFLRTYGRLFAVCVAILLIIVAVAALEAYSDTKKQYATPDPCAILTNSIANAAAGSPVTKQLIKPAATVDTSTTYCVYRGANASASLTVRSPKNDKGAALNKQAFTAPPVANQKVIGYGEMAYWVPSFGQLNILKDDQWYILASGSNQPKERTLEQAKKLADQVINRL